MDDKLQTVNEQDTTTSPESPPKQVGLKLDSKIARTDLEILVYGVKSDQKKIDAMNKDIYNQMCLAAKGYGARILHYTDNGELTKEKKEKWLIEHSNCHFYVFADNKNYKVAPDFVKKTLSAVVRFAKAYEHMHSLGIIRARKKATIIPSSGPSLEDFSVDELKEIQEHN